MSEPISESNGISPEQPIQFTRTTVSQRADFSAQLDSFSGPLDLLLYLLKENEVEIADIQISKILDQYLKFMDAFTQWDLQLAGEFLVMAVTLMEIKSRELLPVQETPEGEEGELIEDPRSELVRQLLEYRRLKDQAKALEDLQDWWQCQHPRGNTDDLPEATNEQDVEADRSTARGALVNIDLYGLFASYEKVMKAVLSQAPRNIVLDTESLEDRVNRIERILKSRPFAPFFDLILDPTSRSDIAATFFALLELVRRRSIRLIQDSPFGNFDVRQHDPNSPDAQAQLDTAAAEEHERSMLQQKAEKDALLAQGGDPFAEGGERLKFNRKRGPVRPKFEGIVKPEDVEEIDAEEAEINRRIDAILAAADAISERFEQSREGRVREEEAPSEGPKESPPEQPPADK